MKHTQGPWKQAFRHIGEGRRVYKYHPESGDIDMHDAICDLETWQDDATTKANAQLISAAPDMFEALIMAEAALFRAKTVLGEYATKEDRQDVVMAHNKVRSAMEKAYGVEEGRDENYANI